MGKPTGFKEFPRQVPAERPPADRVEDYREFLIQLPVATLQKQGARCMDCGLPFCHTGCPLGNIIPDFNDLVYHDDWRRAIDVLHATNNFPEITGRVCPAPCEEACVLGIIEPPVTIKNIELAIIERAFEQGYVKPEPPAHRTGKTVAVVGSGPAGLAAAQQLNRAGHLVTVFERADRIGGLLRYGIPDFKLEKHVLDRRLTLMEAEGIVFRPGVDVGRDLTGDQLRAEFDAVVLCGGSTRPRDLPIPGRDLDGIHFAMEFLPQQNKRVAGHSSPWQDRGWWLRSLPQDLHAFCEHDVLQGTSLVADHKIAIDSTRREAVRLSGHHRDVLATGKHVIIIGGGDTGSDCVGTSNRQQAQSITQFELLPKPPDDRPTDQPWPYYPMKLRTSSSHKEGCQRHWSICTKRFNGRDRRVVSLDTVGVEWVTNGSGMKMRELPGTERTWPADLVLLAMGFVGPETDSIVAQLGCDLDDRGNVRAGQDYATSAPAVFACGDMRRGQSLVVWAISEGREAARSVDTFLMGHTDLPTKGPGDLPRP